MKKEVRMINQGLIYFEPEYNVKRKCNICGEECQGSAWCFERDHNQYPYGLVFCSKKCMLQFMHFNAEIVILED